MNREKMRACDEVMDDLIAIERHAARLRDALDTLTGRLRSTFETDRLDMAAVAMSHAKIAIGKATEEVRLFATT